MSNFKCYILLFLIILAISSRLKADVAFIHYGTDKGLPDVHINVIGQDSAGFIWLAGENILYRFDGNRFINYQNITNNHAESFFGKILSLHTDSRGTLWIGSTTGLARYDFPGDAFIRHKAGWEKEDVHDLAEDNKGNLWMATYEGLARLNPETMETTWFTDSTISKPNGKKVLPTNNIYRLTCDNNGKIWFSDKAGNVFLFDPDKLKTETFGSIAQSDMHFPNITKIRFINNRLFISTLSNGLYWYDTEKQETGNELFSSLGQSIHHFSTSNDSVIWLAGDNGLFRYNIETGTFRRYTQEQGNPLGLTKTKLSFVFADKENNLWVSSGYRGVDYGLINNPFQHLVNSGNGHYQLSQPEVTAIEFDKDENMWLGYEAGFVEKHLRSPQQKIRFSPKTTNNNTKPGAIFKIFADSKNRIWLGGFKSGLQQLNPATSSFQLAPMLPNRMDSLLRAAEVRDIFEDDNGFLWVSYHGIGLGKYDPVTFRMVLFRHNPHDVAGSLANNHTLNFCTDMQNNLWIATANGVSKLNLSNETFKNYYPDENNPSSLNFQFINTIYCDPGGNVWAGTDKGLNLYNSLSDSFIPVLNSADNLSYSISGIQSTQPGQLWASTRSGLINLSWSRDSLQNGVVSNVRLFNRRSGLLCTSYFDRSSAKNNEGLIFFGGNKGIDFFNAEKASAFQLASPVPVLTELKIDGVPVWFNFKMGNSLNLDHQHRSISIRFAAPSFNYPGVQNFRYRLKGFDNQWHYTNYEQMATYTNLPAGKYTFRVETEDINGNWAPNAATLSMTVTPPFWNTLLFYFLVVAVVALLIFTLLYARSRIFLLRQKELEKIIDSRTRELLYNNAELEKINQTKNKMFSIISHDLRSPFAGVLGILQLLTDEATGMEEERKKELLVLAKKSAENTYELLDNLLTWAHSQMKQTLSKPVTQNLSSILNKNIELKKTAARQKEIEILKDFPEELKVSFDRDMINTVVRNLLNNAIKFTHPGGKIKVAAVSQNGEVTVSIADTGIGIDHQDFESIFYDGNLSRQGTLGEKGTGLGLTICREFVEKNAGKIWASPNQPKGTVFHFTLPKL